MTPTVNVDVPMPKPMLEALTLLETYCIATNTNSVDHEFVCHFLQWQFSKELAKKFKNEYLYQ
jgi:hypothetical protein